MTSVSVVPALAIDDAVRRRGFTTMTAVLALFLAAAAAPTPLYGYYAQHWHFSAVHLTAVFAVYALTLLLALLLAGSLSDAVGRRPVILAALTLQAAAMVLFLVAGSLAWLYVARVVQGAATGLVTAAVAAALLDFQSPGRPGLGSLVNAVTPTFGLAAGALGAGALVQYAAAPTRLVYAALLGGFLALAVLVAMLPESVAERSRPRLQLRIGVEPAVRAPFLAALPCLIATWALGGLYLSLGPSLALTLLQSTNRLAGAAATVALTVAGGVAALSIRSWAPPRAMLVGCVLLVAGAAVTVVTVAASSAAGFIAGSAVAGLGFGASFLGAFRTLAVLATPQHRGELIAAVYIACYVAFSVPAVVAGVAATHAGLHDTAIGFGCFVGLLALLAISLGALTGRRSTRTGLAE